LLLKDGGILIFEETEEREQIRLLAGIDDMVGASQQLIHMRGIAAGSRVLPEHGEIGGNLAVEQGHLPQFRAGQLSQAACVGLDNREESRSQWGRRLRIHWLERIWAMDLSSDQLSIETPELVAIEMPLAGIGSRFIALLVDYLIWGAGLLVLFFLALLLLPGIHAFSKISAQWAVAILVFLVFLFNWGYFTLFEAFWNGRTPGKRVARIRVIQRTGQAIGLFESMTRNLVRYVDQFPFFMRSG